MLLRCGSCAARSFSYGIVAPLHRAAGCSGTGAQRGSCPVHCTTAGAGCARVLAMVRTSVCSSARMSLGPCCRRRAHARTRGATIVNILTGSCGCRSLCVVDDRAGECSALRQHRYLYQVRRVLGQGVERQHGYVFIGEFHGGLIGVGDPCSIAAAQRD